MTKINHVLGLIRSHANGDDQRFIAIATAIAGDAEAAGHTKTSRDIRQMIDQAKNELNQPMAPMVRNELSGLMRGTRPETRMADLILSEDLRWRLERVIREYECRDLLAEKNLKPRRKFLLSGPPGTGKTMTASALAGTLDLPLFTISLDGVISKFMGETATKLRQIFDAMTTTPGIYFFDEVDALAASRGTDNDVGEARRMLNSFLMLMEEDKSNSFILAATNFRTLLDSALFRRFDAAFVYGKPSIEDSRRMIHGRLARFDLSGLDWDVVLAASRELSQAELVSASEDAAIEAVLDCGGRISTAILCRSLRNRREVAPA